ncbi:MAG TPA: hypothetical protein VKR83_08080 [Ktedonobacteraceae bacterium]|nr:hypothetical protein [Ktedonobacteraceae bacterium]
MMSAYHELKDGEFDTTDLDVHLERCASCRQALARNMMIGERVRALPELEPPPDMREKVMRALAHEHMQFLQKSAPGTVTTPEFLKPYLHDHARSTQTSNAFSAFSTAETGPLPIIRAKRKSRPRSHMSQFAVLGVAATFLMVLLMGGLTSLLLLAQGNATHLAHISNTNSNELDRVDIQKATYAAVTPYQHIVSAVANSDSIYYTAYQDGASSAWMLLQLDRANKASTPTPLLAQPAEQPIIVLGSTPQWVVWIQYDRPVVQSNKYMRNIGQRQVLLPWSLRILSLAQVAGAPAALAITPTVLLQGTFNQLTAPTWVHTPVQGIWLTQSVLLVAMIDANGTPHLLEYQLNIAGKSTMTEIAATNPGHIFTSPTANSNANEIYWADEWMSEAGVLNSDIWMQQEIDAPGAVRPTHGRWAGHVAQITQQMPFRTDGMSFRPQVADDTLFWLSTATVSNSQAGTPTTSGPPVVTTPQLSTTIIPRMDPNIYAPSLDSLVRGQVLMQPLVSDVLTQPISLNNTGPAYALQVGADFALWQGDKGYEMYDVPTQNDVTTGNILNDATFLAVNGNSAVWMMGTTSNATSTTNGELTPVDIFAFNWPK